MDEEDITFTRTTTRYDVDGRSDGDTLPGTATQNETFKPFHVSSPSLKGKGESWAHTIYENQ